MTEQDCRGPVPAHFPENSLRVHKGFIERGQLIAPPSPRKAYPEAMYDHRMKVINPIVIRKVDLFHESYSKELLALPIQT
jgi:hypothetical protein